MTTTTNNENKVHNFSSEQEQNQACSGSAEHEKNQGQKVLNAPSKRETPSPKRNVPNLRFPEFVGEWERCKLGEIADLSKSRISTSELNMGNYIATENMLQDFQGVVKSQSLPANTNVISFDVGDILISNIRPYLKKVWQATFRGGCSADVFVLKANVKVNSDYLNYIIASDRFINFVMSGAKGVKMPRGDKEQMKTYALSLPSQAEQAKIATLLRLIDERISTQNKIIEDLKKLKRAISEKVYSHKSPVCSHIGDFIEQTSKRNKNQAISNVLSVSNSQGFIQQSEQFENRNIASDDTSNYKIVERNDFAFNPARINVGSIARLTTFEVGIVSPMYICFHVKDSILPEYIDFYFETKLFFTEIQKRLEGSVRQCLSYEGLCSIPLNVPAIEKQLKIGKQLSTIVQKIKLEADLLGLLQRQKNYLLRQMFI